MRDALGPGTHLGYCTNVHGGETLEQIRADLLRVAVRVRELVSGSDPLGIGLWLPARAARELHQRDAVDDLRRLLDDNGLYVFTLNGFPYGDFHGRVVKRRVYQPNWSDTARVSYTRDLALILDQLAPMGEPVGISTLPIAWHGDLDAASEIAAIDNLVRMTDELAKIERQTGRLIHLDIEPEPGCLLSAVADALHLRPRFPDEALRYLRFCHDVCHAAVMFEEQGATLAALTKAGWSIGKMQLSSALRCRWDGDGPERAVRGKALHRYAEPRYLHQTTLRMGEDSSEILFFEDLPDALESDALSEAREARVHFHVPVHLERIGPLETTRDEIRAALRAVLRPDEPSLTDRSAWPRHFEVETYAWAVLPAEQRVEELAEGIAEELRWVRKLADKLD